MDIHEYQAKQLISKFGVSIPPGEPPTVELTVQLKEFESPPENGSDKVNEVPFSSGETGHGSESSYSNEKTTKPNSSVSVTNSPPLLKLPPPHSPAINESNPDP